MWWRVLVRVAALSGLVLVPAGNTSVAQEKTPEAARPHPGPAQTIPESLFDQLDRDRNRVITPDEITPEVRERYGALLERADRNHDGRITRAEFRAAFNQALEPPLYRDRRTYATLLLVLAFAGFCMFLDGVLEPDRRDYLWLALGGCLAAAALAYLCAPQWFLDGPPYLGYVTVVPALIVVVALVTGATRVKEEAPTPGEAVYVIGQKAAGAAAQPQRPPQGPRRPGPPQRTPRPSPMPRPPVPERRPPTPPRAQPPRPPGPNPKSGGPKPPPAKPS